MKLDAVLHIPMSEYCCGLDERHIVYRLRCARGGFSTPTPRAGSIRSCLLLFPWKRFCRTPVTITGR